MPTYTCATASNFEQLAFTDVNLVTAWTRLQHHCPWLASESLKCHLLDSEAAVARYGERGRIPEGAARYFPEESSAMFNGQPSLGLFLKVVLWSVLRDPDLELILPCFEQGLAGNDVELIAFGGRLVRARTSFTTPQVEKVLGIPLGRAYKDLGVWPTWAWTVDPESPSHYVPSSQELLQKMEPRLFLCTCIEELPSPSIAWQFLDKLCGPIPVNAPIQD